jgi:hypothetical protein
MMRAMTDAGSSSRAAPARTVWKRWSTAAVRYAADIEATYRRELSRRGVEFPAPPRQQHSGWWSLFEDPDGTRYAVGQWD